MKIAMEYISIRKTVNTITLHNNNIDISAYLNLGVEFLLIVDNTVTLPTQNLYMLNAGLVGSSVVTTRKHVRAFLIAVDIILDSF